MNVVIVFRAPLFIVRKGLQTTLSFLYPKYYMRGVYYMSRRNTFFVELSNSTNFSNLIYVTHLGKKG